MSEHTRILQTRYKQLLSHVGDLASTAALLYAQDLLSQQELEELGKVRLRSDKEAYLCSCLTGKGVSKLVDISQVLKTEQARHVGVEVGMGTVESERVRSGNGGVAPIKEEFRKAYDVGGHSQEGQNSLLTFVICVSSGFCLVVHINLVYKILYSVLT